MTSIPDGSSGRLRSQLLNMDGRFAGFKTLVQDDTKRRKAAEDQRHRDLRESILRVEKALNTEIKRRVEANRVLQQVTEQLANDMLENLQKKITERLQHLTECLTQLVGRCETLERSVAQLRGDLPSKLQTDTMELLREVRDLRDAAEEENRKNNEMDSQMFKRIAQLDFALDAKMEVEEGALIEQINTIKTEIEVLKCGEDSNEQKFHMFVKEELAALSSALKLASQARDQSDDEIIGAVNAYTNALQKGLRNANLR